VTSADQPVRLRIEVLTPQPCERRLAALTARHTLNHLNGLAVTVVSVLLSLKPPGDGITFHAYDLDIDPMTFNTNIPVCLSPEDVPAYLYVSFKKLAPKTFCDLFHL